MSSKSGKTPRGRVARLSPGGHTDEQPGRSSTLSVVDPGQLTGLRARTRIRSGGATRRSRSMELISVGIDVSKTALVIAVQPSGESWTSDTTPTAIDTLVTRLRALAPTIVVVEATGGYERALVAACAAAGLPIAVVNPR